MASGEATPPFFERLEAAYDALVRRLGRRGMLALSVLSMVWGVISGISLTRDYAHSSQLVGYLALLVVVSGAFHFWLEWVRRVRGAARQVRGVRGALLERPRLVESLFVLLTQYAIQYIMMFCIPLLALAHAWTTLALAVVLVAVSLADDLWLRLAQQGWFAALVRTLSASLAVSFAFAVLWPQQLPSFHLALAVVAVTSALPWESLCAWRRPRLLDLVPALAMVVVIAVLAAAPRSWVRMPLLSVWVRQPAIGTGLADHELAEPWPSSAPRTLLAVALEHGDEICCLTPIVSPSGVAAPVTHEWRVNGQLVDRIDLPAIRGSSEAGQRAFRTFSCKRKLPAPTSIQTLGCQVYLDGMIYLGGAEVEFGVSTP